MVHKMKTLEEVLYDYTRGEKTLEEANKALKELGCGLTLDPTRNLFSARELLDMGQGTAYVYMAGKRYRLRGDVLTEED